MLQRTWAASQMPDEEADMLIYAREAYLGKVEGRLARSADCLRADGSISAPAGLGTPVTLWGGSCQEASSA